MTAQAKPDDDPFANLDALRLDPSYFETVGNKSHPLDNMALDMGPPSDPPDLHELCVEAMVGWFFKNFEDPVENTPRDEGDWVYIWGGPYDARDELEVAFPNADERTITDAVFRIENDGWEWAPAFRRMQLVEEP